MKRHVVESGWVVVDKWLAMSIQAVRCTGTEHYPQVPFWRQLLAVWIEARMAALTNTSSCACRALVHKGGVAVSYSSSVVGVPGLAAMGKVGCSMERKACVEESRWGMGMGMGMGASLTAAVTMSSPAMALVDERLSTEGTGLPFGLSNNLLGWILLGVFALIWALYFVYTSTLDEDDDSGLSL